MKRLLVLIMVLLSSLTLIACGGGDEPTQGGQQLKPGATVITYCSWNVGTEEEMNIYRRQIYKFNETHDDVQIKIIEHEGDYDTFLSTMASARQLPDVFMVNSVPKAVINYLAKDITALAAADDEWATVDSALVESVTYNDRLYGIPCGQYYIGYFANMTLLQTVMEEGVNAREKFAAGNYTTEEFITAVQNLRNITGQQANNTIGLDTTGDMINWLPSTLDTTGNIKHFVWNTEKLEFDLTSDVMYDSIRIINRLSDKTAAYTFQNVENKEEVFGPGDEDALFLAGKMGFRQSGTWQSSFTDARGLDVEFIGYPGANVISTADYMCVSRATKNPELAFEVAKFLSYGVEGTQVKFDVVDEANDSKVAITGLPVVNNEEIAEKWFDYISLDGVKDVYEKVCNGQLTLIVEGNKSTPGFLDARFHATTGLAYDTVNGGATLNMSEFIWAACSGSIGIDTYIADMNTTLAAQINKNIKDAYAQIAVVASKEK